MIRKPDLSQNKDREDTFTDGLLQDTIAKVQRDEGEAISALCQILGLVQENGKTACLTSVAEVLRHWMDRPPSEIARELKVILGEAH